MLRGRGAPRARRWGCWAGGASASRGCALSAGERMRAAGSGKGVYLQAIARALRPLAAPGARTAFLQTLRAVIDVHGQRVSARDRLYLLRGFPTLIVWGERDHTIPIEHGRWSPQRGPGQPLRHSPPRRPLPAPRGPRGGSRMRCGTSSRRPSRPGSRTPTGAACSPLGPVAASATSGSRRSRRYVTGRARASTAAGPRRWAITLAAAKMTPARKISVPITKTCGGIPTLTDP